MSQSKKRNIDEIEDLKRDNKQLRQIIKSLERQLKNENKKLKKEYDQTKLIEEEYEDKTPKPAQCEECGKGQIVKTDLGFRTLIHCNICRFRKVIKNA